ncbi:hypothetical protein B9Z55_027150 [Caenorhabditis nigoni]|uniref:Uncharacterized protein n=1 Tax=Caenorhabditis nigoni TaxID=1611254 RepID=A0A2G5SGZ4_9PELO|nr:hypothetical protein B9Z55_027150 [Caenorhabditis nigoni]
MSKTGQKNERRGCRLGRSTRGRILEGARKELNKNVNSFCRGFSCFGRKLYCTKCTKRNKHRQKEFTFLLFSLRAPSRILPLVELPNLHPLRSFF